MAIKNHDPKETPLMVQYQRIKAKYPDALLLFRVGDFYETFNQDAHNAASVLGIVLTKRSNGAASSVDLAGFPFHALDTYLPKLVRAGYRVAICDQLEDPKLTKTIVKRGVTELITPGLNDHDKTLDARSNNFLCSLHYGEHNIGLALLDVSTGEFYAAEGREAYIDKLLQSLQPSEIIFSKPQQRNFKQQFGAKYYTYALDEWIYQFDYAYEELIQHFQTQSLKGFGVDGLKDAITAAGAILHYLKSSEHLNIRHITSIARLSEEHYVWMDRFTIKNLEIISASQENGKSLLQVLDQPITPMGARTLRKWMVLPLKELNPLEERLQSVEALIKDQTLSQKITLRLREVGDLERLIAKAAIGKISPRETLQISRSLNAIQQIKSLLEAQQYPGFLQIADQLNPCHFISEKIQAEIRDDAPAVAAKGNIFKKGIYHELDELKNISSSGKDYLALIQKNEQEKTGIPSLKVSFNNVFGYFLEVTNAHKNKVPTDWIRKQTLVNAERYVTPELKVYEEKILGAEEKILSLELQLFDQLVHSIREYIAPIQFDAQLVGKLDALLSFATVSVKNNYSRPELNDGSIIEIKNGRHPVIEQQLSHDELYIPNDVTLNDTEQQIMIITGPNMAGKSAFIRQNALIVLMAQIGCFVPASSASIGIVDKIFTRVGASDNLSSGESTFMVEMLETANILNNASDRSLVILDEIGRGTSTYDGISIAWAIAEYLHGHPSGKPKTLFATHYHELNELEEKFDRIRNYNVSVKEAGNKVLFLRKVVPGGSQHSFGIHVAKMAGIPPSVVERANEILAELEQKTITDEHRKAVKRISTGPMQLSMFQLDDPLWKQWREWLLNTDLNTLTPIEAMMKLHEMKQNMKS